MASDVIRFGIVATALGTEPRDAARAARMLGFAGLELDAVSGALDLTSLSGSGRREFRRLLTSHDQQLIALRADLGANGLAPGADIDRALSRLDRVMEASAGLGCALVCVELGPLPAAPSAMAPKPTITARQAGLILLPEPTPRPQTSVLPVPPPDPAFIAQANAAMVELGRRADRYSMVLALRSELASFASLAQVIRTASCPWFGLDLDPVAILHDEWDTDEVFSQLGALVHHVRGRDAIVGAERRTKAAVVGQGNVPWEAIVADLDETGYRGWVTLDPVDLNDRPAAAVSGAKYLRGFGTARD